MCFTRSKIIPHDKTDLSIKISTKLLQINLRQAYVPVILYANFHAELSIQEIRTQPSRLKASGAFHRPYATRKPISAPSCRLFAQTCDVLDFKNYRFWIYEVSKGRTLEQWPVLTFCDSSGFVWSVVSCLLYSCVNMAFLSYCFLDWFRWRVIDGRVWIWKGFVSIGIGSVFCMPVEIRRQMCENWQISSCRWFSFSKRDSVKKMCVTEVVDFFIEG